ncbi:type VI immunity family protein, partial [Variovorax sp. Root411]|uniref:type VI immunity family protein n=1 Tax=Variovorax sp. Root411 TaxID=1736530 RepID=UPI001F26A21F
TPKGVENIRKAIIETAPHMEVSAVRSSATDQDTAAEYEIETLTNGEVPEDTPWPGGSYIFPKGEDGGALSYIKFNVPMDSVTDEEGVLQYEDFLRFVCRNLPVRGGYGGLSPVLPYSFHRFMPQEYALAERFSGLEIDSYAFSQGLQYVTRSYEGESFQKLRAHYGYLKPSAKIESYGFIKSVNWYTLLGDVFVDRLGGEAAVRSALNREDIGIERIGQCVLIRAGQFPRLGAPEEGLPEPYVFVNDVLRVLRNPMPDSLHTYMPDIPHADKKATRHWQARFDLPGAPPIPSPPEVVPQSSSNGWWFTLALSNSLRHFKTGEIMPVIKGSTFGGTYWQRMSDKEAAKR